jgi:hypothetical protein
MATNSKRWTVNPFTKQHDPTPPAGRAPELAAEAQDEADLLETVRQMVKESGVEAVRRHIENFRD